MKTKPPASRAVPMADRIAPPSSAHPGGMPVGARPAPGRGEPAHTAGATPILPATTFPRPSSLVWSVCDPIVQAERARQAEAATRQQAAITLPTAPLKKPKGRIYTTRQAAEWFEVSIKTFLRDYAPYLTALPPSLRNRKRKHRRWDSHEFDRVVDKMTGGRTGRDSSPEELAYVRAQMEKRLA